MYIPGYRNFEGLHNSFCSFFFFSLIATRIPVTRCCLQKVGKCNDQLPFPQQANYKGKFRVRRTMPSFPADSLLCEVSFLSSSPVVFRNLASVFLAYKCIRLSTFASSLHHGLDFFDSSLYVLVQPKESAKADTTVPSVVVLCAIS